MNIIINGEEASVEQNSLLQNLLDQRQPTAPFAIAINDQFITRDRYANVTLQESDQIEIVSPMSGG